MIKSEIDKYFSKTYKQLLITTRKIINKHNRTLKAEEVLAETYIYLIENQKKIVDFSDTFNKTYEHSIYAFTLKFLNSNIYWTNSKINVENNKLKRVTFIPDDEIDIVDVIDNNHSCYQINDIYNSEFIQEFYISLNQLDRITFNLYYYEGMNKAQDLATHLGIAKSSAHRTIKELKTLFIDYTQKNKIH